jgi:hypothetical protein
VKICHRLLLMLMQAILEYRELVGVRVVTVTFCDVGLVGAIGAHSKDVKVAVPVARKSDLLAAWGPARLTINRRVFRDVYWVRAVGIHVVDLPVAVPFASEGDLFAIWRPARLEVDCRTVGETRWPRFRATNTDLPTIRFGIRVVEHVPEPEVTVTVV